MNRRVRELRLLREAVGVPRAEIVRLTGIARSRLAGIEAGRVIPNEHELHRILHALRPYGRSLLAAGCLIEILEAAAAVRASHDEEENAVRRTRLPHSQGER